MKRNNLIFGLIAGSAAALIGAAIWAAITVVTGMQIGYVAIGIGFLTGIAVRWGGKGNTIVFSFMGGILALVACVLGNFLSMVGFFAKEASMGLFEAALNFPYDRIVEVMTMSFSPMDLLFYAIAGYMGWKYSIDDEHINYDDFEPDHHSDAPPVFGPDANR